MFRILSITVACVAISASSLSRAQDTATPPETVSTVRDKIRGTWQLESENTHGRELKTGPLRKERVTFEDHTGSPTPPRMPQNIHKPWSSS